MRLIENKIVTLRGDCHILTSEKLSFSVCAFRTNSVKAYRTKSQNPQIKKMRPLDYSTESNQFDSVQKNDVKRLLLILVYCVEGVHLK